MNENPSASQPRRGFRFSLGMLLALIACICFFLGGNILGQRQATRTLMRKFPTSSKTYSVEDLVMGTKLGAGGPGGAGGGARADFESLMTKIQERCSPETWEGTGGPGRISPFPLNLSLIVSANDLVHQEIEELLTKLRLEKFGPEFEAHLPHDMQVAIAKAKLKTVKRAYYVSDLVGPDAPKVLLESDAADVDGVVNYIKKTIAPSEWGPGGGSTISARSSEEVVDIDTTPIVHQAVADILAQVRRTNSRITSEAIVPVETE
jgi:hypothetical protein